MFTALILDSPTVQSLLLAVRIALYQISGASPRVKSGVNYRGVELADGRGKRVSSAVKGGLYGDWGEENCWNL